MLFRKFRTAALAERAKEPELFGEYVRRFWPVIKLRLGRKTAADQTWMIEKLLLPFFAHYRLEKIKSGARP